MERVHDDRPVAKPGEHRRGAADGAGLRRVRVDDVGPDGADDLREPPAPRPRRAPERARARGPRSRTISTPARSATNAIDSSPRATSPATSVVSYPRSASPRARYVTWSAGPPTLRRAITRSTRIGRPFRRSLIAREGTRSQGYTRAVLVAKTLFWGSLGALAWTHVGYPLAAGALARVRERRVAKDRPGSRRSTVIVAAYNEEAVIERRLENLLALDYPADRLEIVVASDASSDRTNALVEAVAAREPRVRLLDCPRGGKVAAQDRAVRETRVRGRRVLRRERDLGARRAPRSSSPTSPTRRSPTSADDFGSRTRAGSNREGLYWRYELWLREQESRLGSVTGGNGSIYALRRGRLRRGRSALGPRPRVPVPDGAGGPARGLRARGARVREADADERDGVRAQGADVRALLGDHAARARCCGGSRPGTSPRSSPTACSATGAACSTSCCSPRASRSWARAGSTSSRSPASSRCSPPSPPASRSRGTTSTSPGRPCRRSGTTSAAASRPRGRRRKEPGG